MFLFLSGFFRHGSLALSCLLLSALPAHCALLLSLENDEGETVFSSPVENGSTFAIRYTHSVALTPVEDFFVIRDGAIWLDRTVYADFGAGLPHNPEGGQILCQKNGKLILSGYDRRLGSFQMRVGRVANHILVIPGGKTGQNFREIPLNTLAEPGTNLTFAVRKTPDS